MDVLSRQSGLGKLQSFLHNTVTPLTWRVVGRLKVLEGGKEDESLILSSS